MVGPDDILDFWFPDGPAPTAERHMQLWSWRMRGGSTKEVIARFSDLTPRAVAGELDHWADTPRGRLALIIVLDQFPRCVWAGTPAAYASDPKALAICLEGLDNGHFDALENVWFKTMYKLPLEHCECDDHLANLDRAVAIADATLPLAPPQLQSVYAMASRQPKLHREVIARFGRHSHRNAILGRVSTPEEEAYIREGVFPHQTRIAVDP